MVVVVDRGWWVTLLLDEGAPHAACRYAEARAYSTFLAEGRLLRQDEVRDEAEGGAHAGV